MIFFNVSPQAAKLVYRNQLKFSKFRENTIPALPLIQRPADPRPRRPSFYTPGHRQYRHKWRSGRILEFFADKCEQYFQLR